jgi:hypothetical protein
MPCAAARQLRTPGHITRARDALVVDPARPRPPEHVQHARAHEEAADGHPEPVSERGHREREDEERAQRGHEHDEGLCREQVEEEPEQVRPEAVRAHVEVAEPVREQGEKERDDDCACVSGRRRQGGRADAQRYGTPITKLASMKLPAPYKPFARSLTNVARSSRNAGTYATAMKDMNAEPKKSALILTSSAVSYRQVFGEHAPVAGCWTHRCSGGAKQCPS